MTDALGKRRRDAPKTKANILAAAQKAFSEMGYSRAGLRDIAAIAGVDSALITRYFGTKASLFEAALSDAINMESILAMDRDKFGEIVASSLNSPHLDIKAARMGALSTGDLVAQKITAKVTETRAIAPLARWLGPPNARGRAAAITTLCMGYLFCTRQFPFVVPLQRADKEDFTLWLGRTVQAIVAKSK